MTLRVDGGPAVKLQSAGRRGAAQEGERQLSILTAIPGASDDDAAVGAGQDLGLAVEIRGGGQQRPQRGAAERPARLLPNRVIEEGQPLPVGDEEQIPAAICEAD